jgi:outer membrane receptor protein involved in Fe transport
LAPAADEACAAPAAAIQLSGGSLVQVLRELANRTDSEIVSVDPDIARIRITARTVSSDVKKALRDVLGGTDYRAIKVGRDSYRIERRPAMVARRPTPPSQAVEPDEVAPLDLVVTATKFPVPLLSYPGSVTQTSMPSPTSPSLRADDMDDIARRLPVVQSTEFGEGRNKFFIRGIADSSFNGATQPTASIYFGDALLGFGSPSPNLKLYDVQSVEILEGPQGTLYGSGSIGGVVRITPNPVDVEHFSGSLGAGVSATLHGSPGWDANGAVNLPIVDSRVGMRLVAYHERDGGYIDEPHRGRNINDVEVNGGRASLAAHLSEALTVEGTFLHQSTHSADSQYIDARPPSLMRSTRLAEPYSNILSLGRLLVEYEWASALKLTSVTSLGSRTSFDVFDSTPDPRSPPVAYQLGRSSSMVSNETRLSRRRDEGLTWVVGFAYQWGSDGQTRALGIPDQPTELDEVTNITYSISAFGQASMPLGSGIEATLGARATSARTDSEPGRGGNVSLIRGRQARRVDPTIALSWRATPQTSVYGRLQSSYRNGGVAVARGVGRVADFATDEVIMGELGVRHLRRGARGVSLSGAASYTYWTNIQADLVSRRGLPYTANIGDAKVLAVEAIADWIPLKGLNLGASLLYADNRLTGSLPGQSAPQDQHLPDVPAFSGTAQADYEWGRADMLRFRLGGSLRYIGRSVLGPGQLLDLSQGNYAVLNLRAGVRRGGTDFSLSIDNATDTHANRFALGNPLALFRRDQFVPMRPLTVRAAVGFAW